MNRQVIAGVLLAATGMPAQAELPDLDISMGVSPMLMNYRAKEPEENTGRELTIYPVALTSTVEINRISRIYADLRYIDVDIPAEDGGLGLTAKGYQLTTAYQRQFRLARDFRPWVGIGVVSSKIEFSDRFTTDNSGFLGEVLEDREETGMSALLMATLEWQLTRSWTATTDVRYEHPLPDGFEGYGIAAGVRYRF